MNPETSIVIRAFNEERWLPHVFQSLARQTYRDFEVILVDSGSIDRTREIAESNGAKIVRLRSSDFTFGHSLNLGVQAAGGRFIGIVSAHAIPSDEHWLANLVAPLRRPAVAMVYGKQRGHEVSKFSECRDFERIFSDTPSRSQLEDYFANNANSAIKRSLWARHPFDEGLPGLEDIEWAKYWILQGMQVVYEPGACIVHVHTESWAGVRNRYYREAMAARWVGIRVLRHIPFEVFRELRWASRDLFLAVKSGQILALARQILRFRLEKTIGTVKGIMDSRGIDSPGKSARLFFHSEFPAVVITGVDEARLEDRVVPSLKPGEVLVRVAYVGICATDLEILDGTLGYYSSGMATYPIVPGHEASGTVVALGPRVTELAEGDRVVVEPIQGCGECRECRNDAAIRCKERSEMGVIGHDGAYATFVVTRARYVHKVPAEVTLSQAALAEPLAVVLKGLRRVAAVDITSRPRRCAVVGAGTIGHLAARVLAMRGHDVTVIDREHSRLDRVRTLAKTQTNLDDIGDNELIVEATGDPDVLMALLGRSATGATVLLLGFPYGHRSFSFESIVGFDRSVVGSVGSSAVDFQAALEVLPTMDTSHFREAIYSLQEFRGAWTATRSRSHLKVMLKVDRDAA